MNLHILETVVLWATFEVISFTEIKKIAVCGRHIMSAKDHAHVSASLLRIHKNSRKFDNSKWLSRAFVLSGDVVCF